MGFTQAQDVSGGSLSLVGNTSLSGGSNVNGGQVTLSGSGSDIGFTGGVIKVGSGSLIIGGGSLNTGGSSGTIGGGSISIGGGLSTPGKTYNDLLLLTQGSGSTVIGGGVLNLTGPIIVAQAYVALGNTLRLSPAFPIEGTLTMAVFSPILVIDGSTLTGSNGIYDLPPALSNGATFSTILVIYPPNSPPINLPPIVIPPIVTPPVELPPVVVPNHVPIAVNVSLKCNGSVLDIPASTVVVDGDGDPLTFTVKTPPAFGVVIFNEGVITYAPNPEYLEGDSFTLIASDNRGGEVESTVQVSNPFAHAEGTYFGSLSNRGAVYATINRFGAGTFNLRIDGLRTTGSFTLNPNGATEIPLTIHANLGTQPVLTFDFVPGTPPVLHGVVTGIHETGTVDCQRRAPSEITAQYEGQYNVELAAMSGSLKSPFGFAIAQVKADGSAKITGRLPNGRAWSTTSSISEIGDLPLHVEVSASRLVFVGNRSVVRKTARTLFFGGLSLPSSRGAIFWARPEGEIELRAAGTRFERQSQRGLNVFGQSSTRAFFSLGSPAISRKVVTIPTFDGFSTQGSGREVTPIRIDGQNKAVQLAPVPPLVTLGIKPDGRFSGTYVTPKTGELLHFNGILHSSGVRGQGVITGGSGGYVLIEASNPNQPVSGGTGIISVGSTTSLDAALTWITTIPENPRTEALPVLIRPDGVTLTPPQLAPVQVEGGTLILTRPSVR